MATNIPKGYCQCGCGQETEVWANTSSYRGRVKGQRKRYLHNHHAYKSYTEYIEEDCGYNTACWIWQRYKNNLGYGMATIDIDGVPTTHQAHRLVYERHKGPVPEGLQLDHLCRVPSCVNPAHLEPVTPAENFIRGRGTKLTWAKVREIRMARKELNITMPTLAKEFGVTRQTIGHIVRRKTWIE